jgi:hypothetical protein
MEPQFEELARVIRGQVAEDTVKAIGALETRLDERIDTQETRLDGRIDSLETRLEKRMQAHFERIEDLVQRAAEGYGATLESIDRRLDTLETKWDTQIADHGLILADRGRRISALEQAPE